MKIHRISKFITSFGLVVLAVTALGGSAHAAFDPNRIIDDSVFTNTGSMSVQDIQNFLASKVPVCDTTHAANPRYSQGANPPWTCLKDYTEGGKSAARIIWENAQNFGINPQVILVTLQKENALVTDTWPYPWQYRTAMGFACPDTAACDPAYFGFAQQVFQGARHLSNFYNQNPNWFIPHRMGANFVDYNPNSGCGGTNLFINKATSALYSYTPYQPNAAALANMYGLGDGCSAYGNRNFWRDYTNWFGTTYSAFLYRSVESPSVYLVNGNTRYPILNQDMLDTYSMFGPVQFIGQPLLSSLTAGPAMSHFGKDPATGAIYLFDSRQKIQFSSCGILAAYGGDCATVADFPDTVLFAFSTSAYTVSQITRSYSEATVYRVEGGKKRFAPNLSTLQEFGYDSQPITFVSSGTIASIPDGAPLVKNNSVISNIITNQAYFYSSGSLRAVPGIDLFNNLRLGSFPAYSYPGPLVSQLAQGADLSPLAQDSSAVKYLIDSGAKRPLGSNSAAWSNTFTPLPAALIDPLPVGSNPGLLIRGDASPNIFAIESLTKRPIPSFGDFTRLGFSLSGVTAVNQANADSLTTGIVKMGSLSLFTLVGSGAIEMVDGPGAWHISSPTIANSYGFDLSTARSVNQATFNSYATKGNLPILVSDGTTHYLVDGGTKHDFSPSIQANFGFADTQFSVLDPLATSNLASGSSMTQFVKGSGSTIYQVQSGQKHPFGAYQTYSAAGGTTSNTLTVSDYFLQTVPTGAAF